MKNRRALVLAIVASCSPIAQLPGVAESPVTLVVNRRIVPAGSDLLVMVKIPRDADNRALTIAADSDDYARSSTMPLDGEFEAAMHQYWFKQLPEGEYHVVARVTGTRGVRGIDTVSVSVFGTMKRK